MKNILVSALINKHLKDMDVHDERIARGVWYCSCCDKELPVERFYRVKTGTKGMFNYCKQCTCGWSRAKLMEPERKALMAANKAQRGFDEDRRREETKRLCPHCNQYFYHQKRTHWHTFLIKRLCHRSCPPPKQLVDAREESYKLQALEYAKEYNKRPGVKEQLRRRHREQKHMFAWRTMLRGAHARMGTVKQDSTIKELGYSALQLKEHMAALFTEGMSWSNHGKWHIDHIKPVSKFAKSTPPGVVNALSNLQPLWAADNIRKKDKYIEPYEGPILQPVSCEPVQP